MLQVLQQEPLPGLPQEHLPASLQVFQMEVSVREGASGAFRRLWGIQAFRRLWGIQAFRRLREAQAFHPAFQTEAWVHEARAEASEAFHRLWGIQASHRLQGVRAFRLPGFRAFRELLQ